MLASQSSWRKPKSARAKPCRKYWFWLEKNSSLGIGHPEDHCPENEGGDSPQGRDRRGSLSSLDWNLGVAFIPDRLSNETSPEGEGGISCKSFVRARGWSLDLGWLPQWLRKNSLQYKDAQNRSWSAAVGFWSSEAAP